MLLSGSLKRFVEKTYDLIDEKKFDEVYKLCHNKDLRGQLTELLLLTNSCDAITFTSVIPMCAYKNTTCVTSMTLEEGIVIIEDEAFHRCVNLREVWLPRTLESIGVAAFSGCEHLQAVHYAGTIEEWDKVELFDNTFRGSAVKMIICSDGVVNWES